MLTGLEIIACPSEAYAGELVNVRVRTTNRSFSPNQYIMTGAVVRSKATGMNLERIIDEDELFASGTSKTYSGNFSMYNEDVYIAASTAYRDMSGIYHPDASAEKSIDLTEAPPPPPPPPGYWITVAEGNTIAELQADAAGKYIADEFRYVIETHGAPSWLLKGATWIVNQLTAPLNAIGVDLEYVGIKDGTIYIYMHGSPAVFSTTAIVIASMVCFTIIAVYCTRLMIQQKLTEQQYYKLKEAEVKADVIEAIKDLPPEVQDTLLELWEAGIEPEKEGIDWEKYLKWGLIGGGVILGASVLIPPLVRALRGRS